MDRLQLSALHRLLACLWLVSCAPSVSAQSVSAFQIESASTALAESVFFLDAQIDIELPRYIEMAVNQGFALPLKLEVDILRDDPFWFDSRVVRIKFDYLLHYLPILESVAVFDINGGYRRYYPDLAAALMELSSYKHFVLLDNNPLDPDKRYYGRLRFGIDQETLPLPLKSSSFWDNDWDLISDWHEWEIRP